MGIIVKNGEEIIDDKEGLKVLLKRIEAEVFSRNGSGFTWEISPEIIVTRDFTSLEKWFSKKGENPFYWKLHRTTRGGRYHLIDVSKDVDKLLWIAEEIEKELPDGVFIEKTSPCILIDQTSLREPTHYHDHAIRTEGRRLYLTVTDEYATRVFREVYTDIGLPFRNLLLTKYRELLREIILEDLGYGKKSDLTHTSITINPNAICVWERSDSNIVTAFNTKGMQPLASTGQIYGMTLALIETLKECNPEFLSRRTIHMYSYSEYIEVCFPVSIKEPPKKLKEW